MRPLVALLLLSCLADAGTFYCDPVNGSKSGDGSLAKPWATLAEVVTSKQIGKVQGGDTIVLLEGDHGAVTLYPKFGVGKNAQPITVQAMPGHSPSMTSLGIREGVGWTFRGIDITTATIVCDGLVIDQCGFGDPAATVKMGLSLTSMTATISNCRFQSLQWGMGLVGSNIVVENNLISDFLGDAINFKASNLVIRGNRIVNHIATDDDSHHDAIQGMMTDGTLSGITIEDNFIQCRTDRTPSGLNGDYIQGITIFDGDYQDVTIRNNTIRVPATNGIAMAGVRGLQITNNTVLCQCNQPNTYSAIVVSPKKATQGATPPSNVIVQNNVASLFLLYPGLDGKGKKAILDDHNVCVLTAKKKIGWTVGPTNLVVDEVEKAAGVVGVGIVGAK